MRRVLIVAALVALDAAGYLGLTLSHHRKDENAPAATAGGRAAAVNLTPVAVYPAGGTGGAAPRGFVIYFSDAGGWTEEADRTASALAAEGFAVAALDSRSVLAALEAAPDACVHPVQPLVNLAAEAESSLGWHNYRHPVLAGRGLGGTLAYAALAQAVPGIFAAGVSTGFADVLPGAKSWCSLNGYTAARVAAPVPGWRPGPASALPTPWRALAVGDGGAPEEAGDPAVAAILAGSPGARALSAPSEAEGILAAVAPLLASPHTPPPERITS